MFVLKSSSNFINKLNQSTLLKVNIEHVALIDSFTALDSAINQALAIANCEDHNRDFPLFVVNRENKYEIEEVLLNKCSILYAVI